MKKFIVFILLIISILSMEIFYNASAATSEVDIWDGSVDNKFASGTGSESDPYIIETPDQLAYLASSTNNGNTYSLKYFKLANNIYLNDETFNFNSDTGLITVTDGTNIAYLGTGILGDASGSNAVFDETAGSAGTWYVSDKSFIEGTYSGKLNEWTAIGSASNYFRGNFDGSNYQISGIYINSSNDYQGLFGYTYGGVQEKHKPTISNVSVVDSYIYGGNRVGGIIGFNYGTDIINCSNTSLVFGTDYIGGIAGFIGDTGIDVSISNLHNSGCIMGSSYVGGITGKSSQSMTNCYNNCQVIGTEEYVGGLSGYLEGHNTISYSYNTGSIEGYTRVGGIVGYFAYYSGFINMCYNNGNVTANGNYVGGISGDNYNGTISDCYNIGVISGKSSAGGISGTNNNGSISNCYNAGSVTGTGTLIGGVLGHSGNKDLKNCYYLIGCALDGNNTIQNSVGSTTLGDTTDDNTGESMALSEDSMQQQSSFTGFDFDTIWEINHRYNHGYPYLKDVKILTYLSFDIPIKTTYHEGEYFDPYGIKLMYEYTDGIFGEERDFEYSIDVTAPLSPGTHVIEATNHSYTGEFTIYVESHTLVKHNSKPATCTEIGWNAYDTCSLCDYSTYEEIPATGHSFTEWTVTTEPTCSAKGVAERSCSCGAEEKLPIKEMGHKTVSHEAKAPTCTEIGWAAYEACSRCEHSTYVEIPAVGHKSVIDAAVDATCSETGLTEGSHCSVCSEVITAQETVPTTEHSFSEEWTVDKAPTKTENGSKSRHCANCDANTDVIEFIDSSLMFIDIPFDAWYKDAVDFVVFEGLMNGIGGDKFSPDGSMTRAMVVTVLWRMEGSPTVSGGTPFTDITADWYSEAVEWAYKNAIVNGTSGTTFSPDGEITREQIATILYRYSEFKGYDTSASADLGKFPDGSNAGSWAQTALSWANGAGLITGASKNGAVILDPQGKASRAQVATILMRFCQM